jgi:hypothetical protein
MRYGNWYDGNLSILHFPGSSYPWQARWKGGIPYTQHKAEDLTLAGLRDQLASQAIYFTLGRKPKTNV